MHHSGVNLVVIEGLIEGVKFEAPDAAHSGRTRALLRVHDRLFLKLIAYNAPAQKVLHDGMHATITGKIYRSRGEKRGLAILVDRVETKHEQQPEPLTPDFQAAAEKHSAGSLLGGKAAVPRESGNDNSGIRRQAPAQESTGH